jgi:hypothetical protein
VRALDFYIWIFISRDYTANCNWTWPRINQQWQDLTWILNMSYGKGSWLNVYMHSQCALSSPTVPLSWYSRVVLTFCCISLTVARVVDKLSRVDSSESQWVPGELCITLLMRLPATAASPCDSICPTTSSLQVLGETRRMGSRGGRDYAPVEGRWYTQTQVHPLSLGLCCPYQAHTTCILGLASHSRIVYVYVCHSVSHRVSP